MAGSRVAAVQCVCGVEETHTQRATRSSERVSQWLNASVAARGTGSRCWMGLEALQGLELEVRALAASPGWDAR